MNETRKGWMMKKKNLFLPTIPQRTVPVWIPTCDDDDDDGDDDDDDDDGDDGEDQTNCASAPT